MHNCGPGTRGKAIVQEQLEDCIRPRRIPAQVRQRAERRVAVEPQRLHGAPVSSGEEGRRRGFLTEGQADGAVPQSGEVTDCHHAAVSMIGADSVIFTGRLRVGDGPLHEDQRHLQRVQPGPRIRGRGFVGAGGHHHAADAESHQPPHPLLLCFPVIMGDAEDKPRAKLRRDAFRAGDHLGVVIVRRRDHQSGDGTVRRGGQAARQRCAAVDPDQQSGCGQAVDGPPGRDLGNAQFPGDLRRDNPAVAAGEGEDALVALGSKHGAIITDRL